MAIELRVMPQFEDAGQSHAMSATVRTAHVDISKFPFLQSFALFVPRGDRAVNPERRRWRCFESQQLLQGDETRSVRIDVE